MSIVYRYVLLIIVCYSVLEITCAVGLWLLHRRTGIYYLSRRKPRLSRTCRAFISRLLDEGGEGRVMRYSERLGWTLRPCIDDGGLYRTNSLGARGEREYGSCIEEGRIRIATYGDCLTFGEDVPIADTWQRRLEALDGRFEVINFGVDGYGPGQIYLRYLETLESIFRLDVAVMAIVSTNVFKPLNTFRPLYSYDHGIKMSKPGFALSSDSLDAVPNPIRDLGGYRRLLDDPVGELLRIGRTDYYFRTTYRGGCFDFVPSVRLMKMLRAEYRKRREVFDRRGRLVPGSAALRTAIKIFEMFHDDALSRGGLAVFLLLPLEREIAQFLRSGIKPYDVVIEHFANRGFRYVDMLEEFGRCPETDPGAFFIGRHYSAAANRAIARSLAGALRSYIRDPGERSFSNSGEAAVSRSRDR